MKREEILQKAIELINVDRANDYGPAYENHKRIADLWSVVFGIKIAVPQVVLCLILLKIARLIYSPSKTDSWIDIGGYTGLGGEFVEKEKNDK
jgi:hypothetical protein|tara:strand:+ start:511 stop:789 length:279 start_codon:yes stop_codon:yes gene_type:complete